MHDAVQAIQQRFEPYAAKLRGSGSLDAAAGAATHGVLVGIYPKQQGIVDAKYKEFLESTGLTGNPGLAVGQQKTRTFTRFSDAAAEVVEARILLGIHFRFADEVARTQGTQVANWTFAHALRPVKN
jgi:hypothetical protein